MGEYVATLVLKDASQQTWARTVVSKEAKMEQESQIRSLSLSHTRLRARISYAVSVSVSPLTFRQHGPFYLLREIIVNQPIQLPPCTSVDGIFIEHFKWIDILLPISSVLCVCVRGAWINARQRFPTFHSQIKYFILFSTAIFYNFICVYLCEWSTVRLHGWLTSQQADLKWDRKWQQPKQNANEQIKNLSESRIRIDWMILMIKKVTCRFAIATRYEHFAGCILSIQITCVYMNTPGRHAAVHQTNQTEYVFRLRVKRNWNQPKMITKNCASSNTPTKAKLIFGSLISIRTS